ncbi:MAG: hypothetical protein QOF51_2742 [Chloroflexota bacterium]|nr:hypothetical protein [Chloroflexota bacterium]
MSVRLYLALAAGHLTGALSRRLGSGGTVLPGHVVSRLDPGALRHIVAQIRLGAAIISGTNGKTTTARMVSQAATSAGLRPIANRSGSNLTSGIVAAAVAHTSLVGRPLGDVAILEVDEAHVPAVVDAANPRLLALTNVFRDQLDRYGEVDLIAATWRIAIERLDPSAVLVLNADDPIVAHLREAAPGRVVTYGVNDEAVGSPTLPHEADKRLCPACGARLRYTWSYYGHIGHYACAACGWQRPAPDVAVTQLAFRAGGTTELTVEQGGTSRRIRVPLPGLYNAYNALAAFAITTTLGIAESAAIAAIESFSAVFGRQERVAVGSGELTLALVKNPVGFNQVLQALAMGEPPDLIVIAINDLFADGTDVSWLWDVDFEVLAESEPRILCTGLRAHDMALRLKYAGVAEERVVVEPPLGAAVEAALTTARAGGHVAAFPTYTAMLQMRGELQRRGCVAPFWED